MMSKDLADLYELWDHIRERVEAEKLTPQQVVDEIFMKHPLFDLERTAKDCGNPPTKIFLKSPYGFELRLSDGAWIPFRHGPVDLNT